MEEKLRSLDVAVGSNVRGRRSGLGLRQEDLAESLHALLETGWSAPMVSRVEEGRRSLTVTELLAFAASLSATPDELLDPLAFGDDSPVEVFPGRLIPAAGVRAIVRGEVRSHVTVEGTKKTQRFTPTDRRNITDVAELRELLRGEWGKR